MKCSAVCVCNVVRLVLAAVFGGVGASADAAGVFALGVSAVVVSLSVVETVSVPLSFAVDDNDDVMLAVFAAVAVAVAFAVAVRAALVPRYSRRVTH